MEQNKEQEKKVKLLMDLDELKENPEIIVLRDDKQGIFVELHSTKLPSKELLSLGFGAFNFLADKRNKSNNKGYIG